MSEAADVSQKAIEAVVQVIAEAKALGLDFPQITGLVAKRANRLGIDLDEKGRAIHSPLSDEQPEGTGNLSSIGPRVTRR